MIISRAAAFGTAVGLVWIAACGGDAAEREPGSADGARVEGSVAAESTTGSVAVLPGPLPPDPCSILTADRAAEVLQGEATERPAAGGACSYVAPATRGSVRLLLTPYPLDQVELRRGERSTLAVTFGQAAALATPPIYHGDVAGQPAFAAETERASVLFVPSEVMTSAPVSDRPVAEVVVQVSLVDDRPHADRIEALTGIAGEAVTALRRQATAVN